MTGWIKLHRILKNWEWYTDAITMRVFVHLLLSANHKPGTHQGTEIDTGQVKTGRKKIASELEISEKNVRTALKRLETGREIFIKRANKFSLITIENWDIYQGYDDASDQQDGQQDGQQTASKRPANGQQTATNKNVKNKNNNKNSSNARASEGASEEKKNEMPQAPIQWNWQSDAEFLAIRDAYPKRTAPGGAFSAWRESRPIIDAKTILAAIKAQSEAGQIDATRFTPDLENWLKKERWNDDILENDDPGEQNSAAKAAANESWSKVLKIVSGDSTREKTPLTDYERKVLGKTKSIRTMKSEHINKLLYSEQTYKSRFMEDYNE